MTGEPHGNWFPNTNGRGEASELSCTRQRHFIEAVELKVLVRWIRKVSCLSFCSMTLLQTYITNYRGAAT